MRIRKWDGSAWTALSPKVTYTDIVADVTAASPVSIFPSGKLGLTYLPDAVFGGMKFVGTVGYNSNALDSLEKLIVGGSTNWSISSSLDSFTSKSHSNGDYAGIGQQYIGYYWVVQNNVTLGVSDSSGGAADFADEATDDGQDQLGSAPFTISVEHGDWLIITGWDNANSKFLISVINNTYTQASSSSSGVLKLGSSTVQSVGANSVSSTSGRSYALQVNSSGQGVVNVPWTDTNTDTRRAVEVNGTQILSNTSTTPLDLIAGSNVTISNSGGNVTIAATDTNTTYSTATSSTLGLVKIGYTENGKNYPVELSSGQMFVNVPWTDTDTNTTYSAGSGIALSGTSFSVAGGVGLTQEASGLKMENPIEIGTSTPASGYQITNGALWFDLN